MEELGEGRTYVASRRRGALSGRAGALIALGAACLGAGSARAQSKVAGIGDSISQGYSANGWLGEHPDFGFVQGTDAAVNSVYSRYKARVPAMTVQSVSVSGAEMVGGSNNAAAQASRICQQAKKPDRVVIELGGNDVCNRNRASGADPTANMYSATTYRNALKAALDTLAGCLPQGAVVQVLSMPRVDYLYEAGIQRRGLYCQSVWAVAGICRIVTGETDAARRARLGARVNEYNEALGAEVAAAQARHAGKLRILTDWKGPAATGRSVGTYRFTGPDINGADCFHPYSSGQRKLACVAWETGELGAAANVASCLSQ